MMTYTHDDFSAGLIPVEPKLQTMPIIESSANQQQLLEQLLFTLTNQLALAAQNNNNKQNFAPTPPGLPAFKPNNKFNNSSSSPKRTNHLFSNNNQFDYERELKKREKNLFKVQS
jgi:hypothetical protein